MYDALGCAPDNRVQSAIVTIGLHNDQVSAHFSRTSNYRLDDFTVTDLQIGKIRPSPRFKARAITGDNARATVSIWSRSLGSRAKLQAGERKERHLP
nr:Alanine racemase [Methylocystis sp. SC2]